MSVFSSWTLLLVAAGPPGAYADEVSLVATRRPPMVLAAASRTEVEEDLERDMERARKAIRGDERGSASYETGPEGSEREGDPSHRHGRYREAIGRYEHDGRGHEAVRDGHGKVYYLVWGLVDWGLAAGLWTYSVQSYIGAAQIYSLAGNPSERRPVYGYATTGEDARFVRNLALAVAAVGVVLGGAGGWVAIHAGRNIRTFRELMAQERLLGRIDGPEVLRVANATAALGPWRSLGCGSPACY